jgi:dienelactone hydrolase
MSHYLDGRADKIIKELWVGLKATCAIDMPGVAVIDYLSMSSEGADAQRIGMVGRSFGGYWAAKMAFLEPQRLRASVVCTISFKKTGCASLPTKRAFLL